jgi:hypothetical protein
MNQLKKHGITVRLLPPKGSLVISPLDKRLFEVFKRKLIKEMELQPVQIGSSHLKAAIRVYNSIPSSSVVNFFKKCGLIGTESLSTIRETFQKQTQTLNEDENVECVELFEKWAVNDIDIDIEGVKTPRHY